MIALDGKAFDSDMERFRKRITFIVNATRARAITEVRRSTVAMRALAKSKAPKASGALRAAILETYAKGGLTGVVSLNNPDHYGQFVEGFHNNYQLGRKPGKWPPPEPIRRWVQIRALARKWKMSEASAVFLVRRKIGRKGTPAQPFMKPAFEKVAPEFEFNIARVFNHAASQAGGG